MSHAKSVSQIVTIRARLPLKIFINLLVFIFKENEERFKVPKTVALHQRHYSKI